MSEKNRLVQTLLGVYAFYGQELSQFAIRVWCDALADVPFEAADAAFMAHLKDTKAGAFCPKPADILRHLKGADEDVAAIAWGEALQTIRAGGNDRDRHCQATKQAIDAMGGWSVLGRADESSLGFLQRRFTELFTAYKRREDAGPLLGQSLKGVALLGVVR